MNADTMRELLFSLAWYDASCHHNLTAQEILKREFPECDFTEALKQFESCKTMPPGPGCPR